MLFGNINKFKKIVLNLLRKVFVQKFISETNVVPPLKGGRGMFEYRFTSP